MAKYINQKRIKGLIFKKKDKVYLFQQNIKTKRPSDKLNYKKIRPFKISKKLLDTNYKLSLP
jgi:phosphorylcholine metabolism protein LicD